MTVTGDLLAQLRTQLDAAQSDAAGALRNASLAQETLAALETELTPTEPTPEPTPTPEPAPVDAYGPDDFTLPALAPNTATTLRTGEHTAQHFTSTGRVSTTGDDVHISLSRTDGHLVLATGARQTVKRSVLESLSIANVQDFTVEQLDIVGEYGEDGIHVTSGRVGYPPAGPGVIRGVRIRSKVAGTQHYDGVQQRGAHDLLYEDLDIDLGPYDSQETAAYYLENTNGGNQRTTLRRSRVIGGGYTLYLFGTELVLEDVELGAGRYGYLYPKSMMRDVTLINVRDIDGTPLVLAGTDGAWRLERQA